MKTSRNMRGFTLIEVMIAVFLLAFGLLAAAQMQGNSIRYNSMGRQMTTAIAYAQSEMEKERAYATTDQAFDQILPGSTRWDAASGQRLLGEGNNIGDFTRTVNIANGTGNPPLTKIITVTIDWRGFLVRTYSLTSVIARPPRKAPTS